MRALVCDEQFFANITQSQSVFFFFFFTIFKVKIVTRFPRSQWTHSLPSGDFWYPPADVSRFQFHFQTPSNLSNRWITPPSLAPLAFLFFFQTNILPHIASVCRGRAELSQTDFALQFPTLGSEYRSSPWGCLVAHNCWVYPTKSSIFINTIDGGLEFVSQGHRNTTDGCCWGGICYCLLPACSPPALDHPATQYSLYLVGGHFLKQMEHACNFISPCVSGASF